MASKKISALPDGGALQDADEFPVARGTSNVRISGSSIQAVADAAEAAAKAASIPLTQKGAASGVATLGSDGLVPAAQLGGSSAALTGATAATRYAGGTTSGSPVTGTFAVGDFVIDQKAAVWVCTVAGTPGTWKQLGQTNLPLSPTSTRFKKSSSSTNSVPVIGVDDNNKVWGADASGLYVSSDSGVTWSANKGFPPNTTTNANVGKLLKFGANLYLTAKDETASLWKVYSAPYTSDDSALVWTARLSLTTGATTLGTDMQRSPSGWGGTSCIIVGEYGDAVGGPSIWRCTSPPTGTWTRVYGPNSALRHVHSIGFDPYNAGHVYACTGDGDLSAILRSTDSGATWSTFIDSSSWQAVQISFTPDWVFFGGDGNLGSVIVVDRATATPYWASTNWHWNEAVPTGASGDRFNMGAWYGLVDPATGIYYCIASDGSGGGNISGLFSLSKPGARLELVELAPSGVTFRGEMYLVQSTLYFGAYRRALQGAPKWV